MRAGIAHGVDEEMIARGTLAEEPPFLSYFAARRWRCQYRHFALMARNASHDGRRKIRHDAICGRFRFRRRKRLSRRGEYSRGRIEAIARRCRLFSAQRRRHDARAAGLMMSEQRAALCLGHQHH